MCCVLSFILVIAIFIAYNSADKIEASQGKEAVVMLLPEIAAAPTPQAVFDPSV